MSTSSDDGAALRSASLSSATLLMVLQFSVRTTTFILNQTMLRMTSPRAFGTAAIHFELLLSTILFLSREGVRNTALRAWPSRGDVVHANKELGDPDTREQSKVIHTTTGQVPETFSNLTHLPMIIGVPLAVLTCFIYRYYASTSTRDQPYFDLSIFIYAVSALLELLSEPMHIRAMGELRTSVRVRAEAIGVIFKTLTTFLLLFFDTRRNGKEELSLLAFAAGQFMYALLVLIMYLLAYPTSVAWIKSVLSMSAKGITTGCSLSTCFDENLLRLSLTMTLQSLVKHVLTEGDKLVVSRVSPLEDQGGYAVAVNYGSLVARIVFQPVEETLRVYFSKLLSSSSRPSSGKSSPRTATGREALVQASRTLLLLLLVQSSLSVVLLVFGTPYMPILLHVVLPHRYMSTSAPHVLIAWLWYLPVLAVNGGLEAFLSSVATPEDLNRQSRWMAAFSVVYILSALLLYSFGFGDTSLVYANIFNLLARVVFSITFISGYFETQNAAELLHWRDSLPDLQLMLLLILSYVIIVCNARRMDIGEVVKVEGRMAVWRTDVICHVVLGVALGLACLALWWYRIGRVVLLSKHKKSE